MFGYVIPNKEELRVREAVRYNAYYCGVCRAIGKSYGEAARVFLNYDTTFAAMLLAGINGEMNVCGKERCAYKPFAGAKPTMDTSPSIQAAADLNILLAYAKLEDDICDNNSQRAAVGRVLLKGAYKKARERCGSLDDVIIQGTESLHRIEQSRSDELDAAPDAFGKMLGKCFEMLAPNGTKTQKPMSALGYNLGKWIYVADAWFDREADVKHGSYNIFNITGADEQRAAFLMNYSLSQAVSAFELLDMKSEQDILDNILRMGCFMKTETVLGGKDERSVQGTRNKT